MEPFREGVRAKSAGAIHLAQVAASETLECCGEFTSLPFT